MTDPMQPHVFFILTTICLLTGGLALFLGRRLHQCRKLLKTLDQELTALRRVLTAQEKSESAPEESIPADPAAPNAKMALWERQGAKAGRVPEKYTFVVALADRGFPAPEIAEILAIPRQEAEQLLNLRKLRHQTGSKPSRRKS